jgi:hypothetical protein
MEDLTKEPGPMVNCLVIPVDTFALSRTRVPTQESICVENQPFVPRSSAWCTRNLHGCGMVLIGIDKLKVGDVCRIQIDTRRLSKPKCAGEKT